MVVDKVLGSRVPRGVARSQEWSFAGECQDVGCAATVSGDLVYEGGNRFPFRAELLGIGRSYSGNGEGDYGCGAGSERLVFQNVKVIDAAEVEGQWRATEFVGHIFCSNQQNFGFRLRIKGTLRA